MDIFGGIFDSITGLFDENDLTNAIGRAGLAISNNPKKAVSMKDLEYNLEHLGINSTFNSSKTGAVESVAPDAYEKAWYARLKKFAEIESDTGVKLK